MHFLSEIFQINFNFPMEITIFFLKYLQIFIKKRIFNIQRYVKYTIKKKKISLSFELGSCNKTVLAEHDKIVEPNRTEQNKNETVEIKCKQNVGFFLTSLIVCHLQHLFVRSLKV